MNYKDEIFNKVIRKFLTFARCSGKTISIVNQAIKEHENGKKCAIVTWYSPSFMDNNKELFESISNLGKLKSKSFEKIHVIDIKIVLKILQEEVDRLDTSETWWKKYPEFDCYDYLYIDAECYEMIILNLMDKIREMRREINDIATYIKTKTDKLEQMGA